MEDVAPPRYKVRQPMSPHEAAVALRERDAAAAELVMGKEDGAIRRLRVKGTNDLMVVIYPGFYPLIPQKHRHIRLAKKWICAVRDALLAIERRVDLGSAPGAAPGLGPSPVRGPAPGPAPTHGPAQGPAHGPAPTHGTAPARGPAIAPGPALARGPVNDIADHRNSLDRDSFFGMNAYASPFFMPSGNTIASNNNEETDLAASSSSSGRKCRPSRNRRPPTRFPSATTRVTSIPPHRRHHRRVRPRAMNPPATTARTKTLIRRRRAKAPPMETVRAVALARGKSMRSFGDGGGFQSPRISATVATRKTVGRGRAAPASRRPTPTPTRTPTRTRTRACDARGANAAKEWRCGVRPANRHGRMRRQGGGKLHMLRSLVYFYHRRCKLPLDDRSFTSQGLLLGLTDMGYCVDLLVWSVNVSIFSLSSLLLPLLSSPSPCHCYLCVVCSPYRISVPFSPIFIHLFLFALFHTLYSSTILGCQTPHDDSFFVEFSVLNGVVILLVSHVFVMSE